LVAKHELSARPRESRREWFGGQRLVEELRRRTPRERQHEGASLRLACFNQELRASLSQGLRVVIDEQRAARRLHDFTCFNTISPIALAKPSCSFEAVTALACAFTSSLALPMAIDRPLFLNIRTSFWPSPIVAMSLAEMPSSFDKVVTTAPLLARGLVMSR